MRRQFGKGVSYAIAGRSPCRKRSVLPLAPEVDTFHGSLHGSEKTPKPNKRTKFARFGKRNRPMAPSGESAEEDKRVVRGYECAWGPCPVAPYATSNPSDS